MDRVKTMKKTFIKIIILFSIVYALISCNEPIFFIVSEETQILKTFIDGSPTNFVIFDDAMYVASGKKIFIYRKNTNKWAEWKKLDGRIVGLATTTSSLYAIYLSKNDTNDGRIKNCGSDSDLNLSNVQSIHASGNVLFACTRNENKYSIYYIDDSSVNGLKKIDDYNSELRGVASNNTNYYLCVSEGIYYTGKSLSNTSNLSVIGKGYDFTGIIELKNNYIAAISNDGKLYEINNTTITEAAKFSDTRNSTGALALWYRYKTDTMPSLLLVGRKEMYYTTSSNYTNGYVEITLNTTTGGISGSFSEPGKSTPTSIDKYDSYVSSLGKKPVNHIIQTPNEIDEKMTLFASTQQDGVWSYKNRGDGKGEQWNAEQ
jgi:hypothetical protein